MFDYDDALRKAVRAYSRLCREELKKGVHWPIIPERRWDVMEDEAGGYRADGYFDTWAMLNGDAPSVSYHVIETRTRRVK